MVLVAEKLWLCMVLAVESQFDMVFVVGMHGFGMAFVAETQRFCIFLLQELQVLTWWLLCKHAVLCGLAMNSYDFAIVLAVPTARHNGQIIHYSHAEQT